MMLPTHAVVGLAIAAPLAIAMPELGSIALGSALLGSLLPDLDMYAGHRRTLHYPTGYAFGAVFAVAAALTVATPVAVGVALVLVGAAVHCQMDRYGGGLELRPWEGTSDRAVYDHVQGRWRTPRRVIRYDGAPEDFLMLAALSVPLLLVLGAPFRWIIVAAVVVGGVYALLRRRLAALAPIVVSVAPANVHQYVPDRYRP